MNIAHELPSFTAEVATARATGDLDLLSTMLDLLREAAELLAECDHDGATRKLTRSLARMRAELPVGEAEAGCYEVMDALVHAPFTERVELVQQASALAAQAVFGCVTFLLDAERVQPVA